MLADRLAAALAGGEQRAATLSNPPGWLAETLTAGRASYAGKKVTPAKALGLVPYYGGVSAIAGAVSTLPCRVYRGKEATAAMLAQDTPQWRMLHDSPNDAMAADEWWELMMGHCLTWGNHFSWMERGKFKTVEKLIPITPDRIEVGVDDGGRKFFILDGKTENVLRETHILHVRGFGGDGVVGYSPVQMARQMLGSQMAIEEFTGKFWRNSAIPFGTLQTPNVLSEEAWGRLKRRWRELHEGVANAGRLGILEEGVEWKQTAMPLEDAQFLQTQQLGDRRIAMLLGLVPPHRYGGNDGSMTYANVEQSGTEFVRYTIGKWLRRFEGAAKTNVSLFPPVMGLYPKFNANAFLRGDTTQRFAAYSQAIGKWMTDEEIRELEELDTSDEAMRKLHELAESMKPAKPEPEQGKKPSSEGGGKVVPFPRAASGRRYRPDQARGPDGRFVDEHGNPFNTPAADLERERAIEQARGDRFVIRAESGIYSVYDTATNRYVGPGHNTEAEAQDVIDQMMNTKVASSPTEVAAKLLTKVSFDPDAEVHELLPIGIGEPHPEDARMIEDLGGDEGVWGWDGSAKSIGAAASGRIQEGRANGFVLIDPHNGTPEAVMSYVVEDQSVYVEYLASSGRLDGAGARLMYEASRVARGEGVGLELSPLKPAVPFYQALGMKYEQTSGHMFFTAEQNARFSNAIDEKIVTPHRSTRDLRRITGRDTYE